MRRFSAVLAGMSLIFASVAMAATSPPVGGGHYNGTDHFKSFYPANHHMNVVVSKSRTQFRSGRFNFVLNGQGGLGSCAGRAYVTVGPSKTREIGAGGGFNLSGHFTFTVPTPYGGVKYHATATIKGAFKNKGKEVTGTLRETARDKYLTCRSGAVNFSASLVK